MDETSADQGVVRLVHDDDRDRYEAYDGDVVVAVLAYGEEGSTAGNGADEGAGTRVRDLRSTVVAPDRSGAGIGSMIVRRALDDIRAEGMSVRATCWFARGWIERHPEYQDLLEPGAGTASERPTGERA